MGYRLRVTGYGLRGTMGYRLRVTMGYRLWVTGYGLQVMGYGLQVTCYGTRVIGHKFFSTRALYLSEQLRISALTRGGLALLKTSKGNRKSSEKFRGKQ